MELNRRTAPPHEPVMLPEVMRVLEVRPGGAYVDCTIGAGGHSGAILKESSPDGRLLGLDADPTAIEIARETLDRYASRLTLVNESFANLFRVARWQNFDSVDGVMFDLGLSSMQLAYSDRGFSFQVGAPLDMRFDPREAITAADLVNTLEERELADLLYRCGEEPRSRAIARGIARARQRARIDSTSQLVEIITKVAPQRLGRVHPATRTFQALRIAVNRELESLEAGLRQALDLLRPGGIAAVISFHSLEDRIVKQFFAAEANRCTCPPDLPVCACGRRPRVQIITRRPMVPSAEEIIRNPRSRSAKLRAARLIATDPS